ncbi:hypothetical protein ACQ4PT_056268 [Festuca glaucescens]
MNPADEDVMEFIRLDSKDFEGWTAKKFARMVSDRLLVRSNVDLHTFQLHWDEFPGMHIKGVRRWMKYAVNHNVKVLDVILDDYDKTHLPPCIFTCHSLQELNLQWGAPGDDLEHIGRVIPDDEAFYAYDEIYLPSLKKLTLRDVEFEQSSLNSFIAHSFECMGYELKNISWRDQPTLESAHIDAHGNTFDGECKFTEILLHAKKLALFGLDIKVMLEKELPTCSVFQSLVTLEIGKWYLTEDLFVVLRFLQLSPRLEKLKLIHKSVRRAGE